MMKLPDDTTILEWHRRGFLQRAWTLKSGDTEYAELGFESLLGSLAHGRTLTGHWTFKRSGFFQPVATARTAGNESTIAVYRPKWTHTQGVIQVHGVDYALRSTGFWGRGWVLTRIDSDHPLLTFSAKSFLGQETEVTTSETFSKLPDRELILLFTWYALVLHQEEQTTLAVTAT